MTIRYADDYDGLIRFARVVGGIETAVRLCAWPGAAAKMAMLPRASMFFDGINNVSGILAHALHLGLGDWHAMGSAFVRTVAEDIVTIKIDDAEWMFAHIRGAPVVWAGHFSGDWIWSTLPLPELLARLGSAPSIVVSDPDQPSQVSIRDDPRTIPACMTATVKQTVVDVERTPGPRSLLFFGPPGGGKTTGAYQLAQAIGGHSRLTMHPSTLGSPEAWELVHTLRPLALILDDVDTNPNSNAGMLITNLERAREYALVIVQTANTTGPLRGANLRPGRTDEAPVLFSSLDPATARALAPSLTDEVLAQALESGLLASYVVELEKRHAAGRDVDAALIELRDRMIAIKDR